MSHAVVAVFVLDRYLEGLRVARDAYQITLKLNSQTCLVTY